MNCSLARRSTAVLALAVAVLSGCAQPPVQVEGVKLAAKPTTTATSTATTPSATPPLLPTPAGGLAVRLLPVAADATTGTPVTLTVQYADAHGGLVGTVEDFGDGGLGGLKISDCHLSEKYPSAGSKALTHTWTKAGTYRVSVTVTTLSCVYGQQDVTARTTVTVR